MAGPRSPTIAPHGLAAGCQYMRLKRRRQAPSPLPAMLRASPCEWRGLENEYKMRDSLNPNQPVYGPGGYYPQFRNEQEHRARYWVGGAQLPPAPLFNGDYQQWLAVSADNTARRLALGGMAAPAYAEGPAAAAPGQAGGSHVNPRRSLFAPVPRTPPPAAADLPGPAGQGAFQAWSPSPPPKERAPQAKRIFDIKVVVPAARSADGNPVTGLIELSSGLDAHDFHLRICACMGVNPAAAELGWKTSKSAKRGPVQEFNTSKEVKAVIAQVAGALSRQRGGEEIKMLIQNMAKDDPKDGQADAAAAAEAAPAADGSRKKRKQRGHHSAMEHARSLGMDISGYHKCLMELEAALKCEKHPGDNQWCYVPPNGKEHRKLDIFELIYWAHKMSADPDNVTVNKPPNTMFSDAPPRPYKPRKKCAAPPLQPLHITINSPSGSSAHVSEPPTKRRKLTCTYVDMSVNSDEPDLIDLKLEDEEDDKENIVTF
ncbi:hypothetical protein AURDEDRAFT_166227 [Auricularia subglabra TFB-10046 SS5]|nr:hypothetical protein AURDEDRAFT_166227 [Auricularia subglabra TFB-10046 SS5]